MTRPNIIKILGALVVATFLLSGCVTLKSSGLDAAPGHSGGVVTLDDIKANPHNFDIYYTGLTADMPTALLFDPKDDNRRVVGDRWESVTNFDKLDQMINFVKRLNRSEPKFFAIVGPNDKIYAYLLAPGPVGRTRVVDSKTIYVYGIQSPLYLGK